MKTRKLSFIGLIPATSLFVVCYLLALWLLESKVSLLLKYSSVILTIIAFAYFIVEEIRWISRFDELQRKIQLEALAITFPLCTLLIMALGLLEKMNVLPPEDWSYRHVWPVFFVIYLFCVAFTHKKYS